MVGHGRDRVRGLCLIVSTTDLICTDSLIPRPSPHEVCLLVWSRTRYKGACVL